MASFACSNCFNSNPEKIDELFKQKSKEGRKLFLVFILNIILNIQKTYQYYCFYQDKKQCIICAAGASFKDTQYGLYQHSRDFKSNNLVVNGLHLFLKQVIVQNNHFVCSLLSNKFYYSAYNWFSGKKAVFTIEYCLKKWEYYPKQFDKETNEHYYKKKKK